MKTKINSIMKTLLIIIAFFNISMVCKAQCQEKIEGIQLQKGMFIIASISIGDNKQYVAEILSVNGSTFTCRFLHSNSIYYFKDFKLVGNSSDTMMQATVVKNKGGAYPEGQIFFLNVYMRDPEQCDLSTATRKAPLTTISTFLADNKSYISRIAVKDGGYEVYFAHSKNTYEVDENFKVTKAATGGAYSVRSKIKIVHARLLIFNHLNKISFLPSDN